MKNLLCKSSRMFILIQESFLNSGQFFHKLSKRSTQANSFPKTGSTLFLKSLFNLVLHIKPHFSLHWLIELRNLLSESLLIGVDVPSYWFLLQNLDSLFSDVFVMTHNGFHILSIFKDFFHLSLVILDSILLSSLTFVLAHIGPSILDTRDGTFVDSFDVGLHQLKKHLTSDELPV